MSDTKNIIIQEAGSFFKKISWKKMLAFLFFVLLSSVFWMMQVYRQKFESTLTIPVKYVNVPDSIVFENELPSRIYVRIKDDGSAMLKYYFIHRRDSLAVDVRDIIKGTQEKVIQGRNFEQLVRGKLFASSELISYSPTRVSYVYAVLHQKKLPVIYGGYIRLASGYLIDGELTIRPDSLLVYGSREALDTLHYAHTVNDTLREVTDDKKVQVAMKPVKGVRFVPNTVELNVSVDKFSTKEVEVPVECINLPENLTIKFFPSSVKIPFFVGIKRYNDISSRDFQVIVDYEDLKDLKEAPIPVRIMESPDYIQTKGPVPPEVEFVLEQK
ncbi:MAG: YbbR-like domain-containing protein [Prevotella sp.]|jgi:YbbR domain-containing protein|nr:YbbR-like domain-containing protein [Prevotella sp.]